MTYYKLLNEVHCAQGGWRVRELIDQVPNEQLWQLGLDLYAFEPSYPNFYGAGTFSPLVKYGYGGKENPMYLDGKGTEYVRNILDILKKHLAGARVIEFGVGNWEEKHERILHKGFGVDEYIAIDVENGEEQEALQYLARQESESAICMEFGVLSEPIMGDVFRSSQTDQARVIRMEYFDRIFSQIHRVTPKDSIFFGVGIPNQKTGYMEELGFELITKEFIEPFIFLKK